MKGGLFNFISCFEIFCIGRLKVGSLSYQETGQMDFHFEKNISYKL